MRAWAAWLTAAAVVVAAGAVAAATPDDDAAQAPFVVTGAVGQPAVARDLAVTVADVRRTGHLVSGGWAADGNWVVVDLDAASVVSEFGNSLTLAELDVDGRTYSASERPASLLLTPLSIDLPRRGSLAFELAADITGGPATLRLGTDTDTRLDTVIELPVTLDDAAVTEIDLDPVDWARP